MTAPISKDEWERQRREATVAYESLRAELCRADAELCATRADAQTSAAALGA